MHKPVTLDILVSETSLNYYIVQLYSLRANLLHSSIWEMAMSRQNIGDDQLIEMIDIIDNKIFESGKDISERLFLVPREVMKELGYINFMFPSPSNQYVYDRIRSLYTYIIYSKDNLSNIKYIGIFMYRDVFARIKVPEIVGTAKITPTRYVELTPSHLKNLVNNSYQFNVYLDQFFDVADIHYG